jgi:hypothetical protein
MLDIVVARVEMREAVRKISDKNAEIARLTAENVRLVTSGDDPLRIQELESRVARLTVERYDEIRKVADLTHRLNLGYGRCFFGESCL